jgi:hypothetical protein
MQHALDEVNRLGLAFIADAPRYVFESPFSALCRRAHTDTGAIAFAGIELVRLRIAASTDSASELHKRWRLFANAFAALPSAREIAHVISTCRRSDQRQTVRLGWLAVGRGDSMSAAIQRAEGCLHDLWALLGLYADTGTMEVVTSCDSLFDLVRPFFSPHVKRLVPRFSDRSIRSVESGQEKAVEKEVGWKESDDWLPIIEALAGAPNMALVVRAASSHRDQHKKATEAQPTLILAGALTSWTSIAGYVVGAVAAAFSSSLSTMSPVSSEWLASPLDPDDPDATISANAAAGLLRSVEPPSRQTLAVDIERARLVPALSISPSGTLIGHNRYGHRCTEVRIPERDRFEHLYVVGQTGTGKSTFMLNMVTRDIMAGHGVTVLDPHRGLLDDIMRRLPPERIDDVLLIDPSHPQRSVGMNVLSIPGQAAATYIRMRDMLIDDLFDTINALYNLQLVGGPMFEQYFRGALKTLLGTRPYPPNLVPTLVLFEKIFASKSLRAALVELGKEDSTISSFWTMAEKVTSYDSKIESMAPYITSKLNRFYQDREIRRILAQQRCIDFSRVVRERQILLFDMAKGRIGGMGTSLLARQIILRTWQAALVRGSNTGAPHFIYADEFHNFATERFAEMLSEARKFRLGLVLAHQYTSQLQHQGNQGSVLDAILGNVGTIVAFRVGIHDANMLGDIFAPTVGARDIAGQPNYRAYVRGTQALGGTPFSLTTMPPSPVIDGSDPTVISDRSYSRHGRDHAEVDAEIRTLTRIFTATLLRNLIENSAS